MDFLSKNIKALTLKYPDANWSNYFNLSQGKYELRPSKVGELTLLLDGRAVHSLYSPREEARKQLHILDSNLDAIILLGFGLGYLIDEIVDIYPNAFIYLAESSPILWRAFFESADRSSVINHHYITMFFGFEQDYAIINIWQQRHHSHLCSITNRLIHQYNSHFYDHLHHISQNYSMRKNVNSRTLERYGKLWIANLTKNLTALATLPGVNHLFQQFTTIPALLVAAGPSLNNYLAFISMLKERMLIVCVDTALPALLGANIQPDIILSVDSQYWNSRHFDYCYSKGSIFVADPSIYPTVLRKNYGFYCYLSSSLFPLGQLIEEAVDIKGALESGGSVATTAFSLCKAMGCSSIWSIGLDLSYPYGATHVRGSRFESWALAEHHRLSPLLNSIIAISHSTKVENYPANKGGFVSSDQRMSLYRLWFEEHGADIPSYNLSDGILIKNIQPASIDNALALSPCRIKINDSISRLATNHASYPPNHEKLLLLKQDIGQKFVILQELAKKALAITAIISLTYKENNISSKIKQLELIDQKIMSMKETKIIEFLLEPFFKNYIKQQQTSNSQSAKLAATMELYQKIINHLTYYIKLFL